MYLAALQVSQSLCGDNKASQEMTGWMWRKPKWGGGGWGGGEIKALAGLVESGVNKKRVLAPPGELGGEPRLSGIRGDRSWVKRGHVVPPAMLTGRAPRPDHQDQRVLNHAAGAGGWLSGGMVIDAKGAGLGCERDIKGRCKRKSGVLLDRNCVASGTLEDPEAIFLF